jgi:hypothetical protein
MYWLVKSKENYEMARYGSRSATPLTDMELEVFIA